MADQEEQLKTYLKKHGYSLTRPRKVVFKTLINKEPQTMAALIAGIRGQVDRASAYRTISLFESLGIVQRLQIGWKYKLELTDTFNHHHHHLTCLKCGRVIPLVEDQALETRLKQLALAHKFQPNDHQIEIRGLCQNCQS